MEENDLVYTKVRNKDEYLHILKILFSYIGVVAIWLFTVHFYKSFGEKWLLPAISVMWIMGAITSLVIAEEREATIKQTKYAILSYSCLLILYKWVLQHIATVTSSQLGASLNVSISSASGVATSGLLQNLLVYLSVMVPIGFLIWCGQKFKVFKGRQTKIETIEKHKGFKNDRRIR